MIKGYITFYWPKDSYRQAVPFMHQLKGIQYKEERPSNYLVIITEPEPDDYNVDIPLLNDWLRTVPQVIRRI